MGFDIGLATSQVFTWLVSGFLRVCVAGGGGAPRMCVAALVLMRYQTLTAPGFVGVGNQGCVC
jgi:hypothetical protein